MGIACCGLKLVGKLPPGFKDPACFKYLLKPLDGKRGKDAGGASVANANFVAVADSPGAVVAGPEFAVKATDKDAKSADGAAADTTMGR